MLSDSGRSAVLAIVVRRCAHVSHYSIGVCRGHFTCSGDACPAKRGSFQYNGFGGVYIAHGKRRRHIHCLYPGGNLDAAAGVMYSCYAYGSSDPSVPVDQGILMLQIPAECADFDC